MENCGNLLLLCNTSGAEGEAMGDRGQQSGEDTGNVKIKIEVEDCISKRASMNTLEPSQEEPQPVSTSFENEQTQERPVNCNNNNLSVEGRHTGVIMMNPSATKYPLRSDSNVSTNGNAVQNDNKTYFTDGTDESIDDISLQSSDKALESSTSGSSFEVSNPENSNSIFKERSVTQDNAFNTGGPDYSISTLTPSQPGVKSTSGTNQFFTPHSFETTPMTFDNNANQALITRNPKTVNEMKSLSQPNPYHNDQGHDMFQQLQNRCSQRSVTDNFFVPGDNSYCVYDSTPSIDSLGQSMSQPMSALQHHTLDQARLQIPGSLGKSAHSAWSQPVTDTPFGCPLASSTPDVGGRRVSMPSESQSNFFQVPVPGYHNVQEPPFFAQDRSRHLEPEHIRWLTNNVPTAPPGRLMYNPDQVLDRNWNATPEGERMMPVDSQRAQVPLTHMYGPTQQSAPLDMSPRIKQPGVEVTTSQRRMASNPECVRETTKATKRTLRTSSEDINVNNPYQPAAKSAKQAPSVCNKAAEKYQISTNVHTLKPRHMISWYIDHLIQENENVTQISKSYTIPVNIFQSKDMYFMEALLKKMDFPTPRFLNWMHNNFPNINIHAVDFSEGRQHSNFYHLQEDMLQGKKRNDIIKDTFFYFQQRRMN